MPNSVPSSSPTTPHTGKDRNLKTPASISIVTSTRPLESSINISTPGESSSDSFYSLQNSSTASHANSKPELSPPISAGSGSTTSNIASPSGSDDVRFLPSLKPLTTIVPSNLYDNFVEFIPNTLYFFCWPSDNKMVDKTSIPKNANVFTTDDQFNYIRFYLDFGPPNIAQILRFWKTLGKKLEASKQTGKPLLAITSDSPDKCTNATLLMCLFMVLEFQCTPAQALAPINDLKRNHSLVLAPYRDAGYGEATYWISISDCVHAFHAGIFELKLLNVDTFDVDQYEFYERVENGDLSWVVPGYFLAMATPHDQPLAHLAKFHLDVAAGKYAPLKPTPPGLKPLIDIEDLAVHLRDKANCKAVVRLNNKLYDRQKFLKRGLDHFELYFPDGSVPPFDTIVKKFLLLCDKFLPPFPQVPSAPSHANNSSNVAALLNGGRGAMAIHCKAGLGRTGSLICCWMIKTFGWTARQCISWCRLMRPGFVVGPQQNWLETVEQQLLQMRTIRPHSTLLNDLDINEGSEDLAKLTMGMAVPIQPRKGKRDENVTIDNNDMEWTGAEQQQESRGYTLRNSTAK